MENSHQNIKYTLLNSDNNSDPNLVMSQENIKDVESRTHQSTELDLEEMKQKSVIKTISAKISTLVHVSLILFVVFILFLSFSYKIELFTWHPILLSVGWSLFATEAILSISNENASVKNRIFSHWILQLCASACIFSGFLIVVINKNINNNEHFKTWHAIIGLVTVILFSITCFIGILALYKFDLRHYVSIRLNKLTHLFFGSVTFILGAITVVLGLYSNWFVKKASFSSQFICSVFIILITLWVIVKPAKNILKTVSKQ